jgi:hypothetical protein
MFKYLLLAGVALGVTSASAADLLVKAKVPAYVGYPYLGSGLYFGVGTEAAVANATASDPNAGTSLYAAGADLHAVLGYQGTLLGGSNWWAGDVKIAYQNLGGTQLCGINGTICSVSSKFDIEERVMVGFPIALIAGLIPSFGNLFPTLPSLPNGVVSTSSHPYLGFGLHETPVQGRVSDPSLGTMTSTSWQIQPAIIIGMKNQWTQGLVINTWAEYSFANTSFALGGGNAVANQGSAARVGVTFEY